MILNSSLHARSLDLPYLHGNAPSPGRNPVSSLDRLLQISATGLFGALGKERTDRSCHHQLEIWRGHITKGMHMHGPLGHGIAS